MTTTKPAVLALPLLLLFSWQAEATVYSVKAAGGGNFTAISSCAGTAVAGDTCEVYAGSYAGWTQGASGAAGRPITFMEHPGDSVTITSGVNLSSRSYITITGFTFNGAGVTGNGTTHHNIIDSNTFINKATAFSIPDGLGTGGSDNVFSNNIVNVNSIASNQSALYVYGDRNRFDNNEIFGGGGDCFEIGGQNVVVRGNYCHDLSGATSGEHIDFVQVIGAGTSPTLSFALIENNIEKNCTNDGGNCHFMIVRTGGPVADTVIARFNYVQGLNGSGFTFGGVGDNVPNARVYNNTIATEGKNAENGACGSWQNAANGVAINNLCYNTTAGSTSWAPFYDFNSSTGGLPQNNGNVAYTSGYTGGWRTPYSSEPTYTRLRSVNPLFANYPAESRLSAASPLINGGVALTAVSSSDSGTGTSLVVNDARFFQPGWAGMQGDWIRVGPAATVQITGINYTTNTLTLASAVTRTPGMPIYIYKDSFGGVVLLGTLPTVGATQGLGTPPSAPTSLRIVP